jgi:hypothetical protein
MVRNHFSGVELFSAVAARAGRAVSTVLAQAW